MNGVLNFYEKPNSPNKEFAIKLAQNFNPVYHNGQIKISFYDFSNEIKKMLEIAQHWKTAQLFIDNHEYNIQNVVCKLTCHNKSHCDGTCYFVRDFQTISRYYDALNTDHYTIKFWINNYFNTITGLEKVNENLVTANPQIIKQAISEKLDETLQFCDRFNLKKINSIIDSLPDVFEISEGEEDDEDDENSNYFTIDATELLEDEDDEDDGYNNDDDDFKLTENQIQKYRTIAEIMAPIFAEAVVKALMKQTHENNNRD
jgi:hypothetical protein